MKSLQLPLLVLALTLLSRCCMAQMPDAEKQEAVRFVNFLRRNVVPKAADMNALRWNDRLAGLAQDAADKCVYQHNYDGPYANLGENVYKGGRRNVTEILMFMFLERENYDFKSGACTINSNSKYPMFNTCGHYLQLASANMLGMGCGIKLCGENSYVLFCEFSKGYSSPPYETGEPGTKCNYAFATYTLNGLCYQKPTAEDPPLEGTLDCKITCLNYGNLTYNENQCCCTCPRGFYGVRCEQRISPTRSVPNDCVAQLVTCQNGGIPKLTGEVCKCECPANYRGDACEVNGLQADNSVYWYLGQAMHYASYYPVDPSIWATKMADRTVQYYLTTEVNAYCKANYRACCPKSDNVTTDANFVTYAEFSLTDGYPQNVLDGSLKTGVYYRLPDTLATACGGASEPYLSLDVLRAAAAKAMAGVSTFLSYMGVKAIKCE